MKTFTCITCSTPFQSAKACKSRTPQYCSTGCFAETRKKYKTCAYCGISFAKWTNDKFCCATCRIDSTRGVPLTADHRHALSEGRKASTRCKGPNLYNWKGGRETLSERMKLHAHKRKSALSIPVDPKFVSAVREAQNRACFYCERQLEGFAAIEHLTPVSKGGDNQQYNLVVACRSCNSKKHDKTLEEYAIQTRNFHWIDKWDNVFTSALLSCENA